MRRVEKEIALELASRVGDCDYAYLADWASQVTPFDFDDVPPQLRGVEPPSDARLASTAFAFRDGAPCTAPIARPAAQRTSYRPTCVEMILTPDAIRAIDRWLKRWAASFAPNATFEMPEGLSAELRKCLTLNCALHD